VVTKPLHVKITRDRGGPADRRGPARRDRQRDRRPVVGGMLTPRRRQGVLQVKLVQAEAVLVCCSRSRRSCPQGADSRGGSRPACPGERPTGRPAGGSV